MTTEYEFPPIVRVALDSIERKLDVLISVQGIEHRLDSVLLALTALISKETETVGSIEELKTDVSALRSEVDGIETSLNDLATRLEDNPTPEAVGAVATEIRELTTRLSGARSHIDSLDPAVEGGSVAPGDTVGEAPAAPEAGPDGGDASDAGDGEPQ